MFDSWAKAISSVFDFLTVVTRRRRLSEQVRRIQFIYNKMKQLIVETNVQRVLIWKAENGGGKIKPGAQIYISVIYEDFIPIDFPSGSVFYEYQRVYVDREYMNLMSEMLEKKSVAIDPEKVDNGIIKRLHTKDGIKYGELHWLFNDKKSMYYCSIGTTEYDQRFTEGNDRALINLVINQIRNAMSGKKIYG